MLVLILIVVEDGLVRAEDKVLTSQQIDVLILIVVEDGLVPAQIEAALNKSVNVLILIVVEDGLVQCYFLKYNKIGEICLNPYCSGRWSSTKF